ncbi:MAG TPA: methyltransferase domain-containing protein [Polyangiaceae bacterium]|nr:methyltransferase domain-containing protein [Polyangiaceae bacterium]
MPESPRPASSPRYVPGWGPDTLAMLSRRTADERAISLLPHLRPGMLVLDAGCGPGSITVGLARAVGPSGQAVGIDFEASQIERARSTAADEKVRNVEFETCDVHDLPYADETFDAVFAHALVEHLAGPEHAMSELGRVLRPGGILCLSSSDWSGAKLAPRTPDVDEAIVAHCQLRLLAGGDPFAGGRLEEMAKAAGFTKFVVGLYDRTDMGYRELARFVSACIGRALADPALATDAARFASAAEAARRWAEGPEGVFVQRWVDVLARRPEV